MFHQDKAAVDAARVTITLATTAARVTPATRAPTANRKSTTAQVSRQSNVETQLQYEACMAIIPYRFSKLQMFTIRLA